MWGVRLFVRGGWRGKAKEEAEEGAESAGLHRGAAENAEFRKVFFITEYRFRLWELDRVLQFVLSGCVLEERWVI